MEKPSMSGLKDFAQRMGNEFVTSVRSAFRKPQRQDIIHINAVLTDIKKDIIATFKTSKGRTKFAFRLVFLMLMMTISVRYGAAHPALDMLPTAETTIVATETATTPEPIIVDSEAADIARVLYGVRQYNLPNNAKKAIMEVIRNRANCSYGQFGDTICQVCEKADQWQGFEKGGTYLAEDYNLAKEWLNTSNTGSMMPDDFYWVLVENGRVTVRDAFEKAPTTSYLVFEEE